MADGIPVTPIVPPRGNSRGLVARLILALIILVVGGWFGWRWLELRRTFEVTDDAQLAGDLIPVTSEIAGKAIKVLADDNYDVKAGQLLVVLDPAPFQIAVDKAAANLAVARQQAETSKANVALAASQARAQTTQAGGTESQAVAGIATAQARVTDAQAGVRAAQAQLTRDQSNLDLAEAEYQRFADLGQKGYVTSSELDAARNKRDTALATVNASKQAVSRAQAQVAEAQAGVQQARAQHQQSVGTVQSAQAAGQQTAVRQQELQTAQAQITQAQADLANAKLQLSRTKIVAPVDGRVGRNLVSPGMEIAPGQNLMAIVPPRIWVEANFKETQLRRLHPGQAVTITVDALPDVELHGTIESLSPASGATFSLLPPENATGNFTKVVQRLPVRIALDKQQVESLRDQLAPGLSVVVQVKVQ